jgi:hypothetical protein
MFFIAKSVGCDAALHLIGRRGKLGPAKPIAQLPQRMAILPLGLRRSGGNELLQSAM